MTTSKISREMNFSNPPPNSNHPTTTNPSFNKEQSYLNHSNSNPFISSTARFSSKITAALFRHWTTTPPLVSVGRTSTATVAHTESQAISTTQTVLSQGRFHPHRWPKVLPVKARGEEDATVMYQIKAPELKQVKDAAAADHETTIP